MHSIAVTNGYTSFSSISFEPENIDADYLFLGQGTENVTLNPDTYSSLILRIAEKTGFSKKDAEKALNTFMDVISDSLVKGDKVQLIGFGTFDVKKRPARVARNPRTGEEIKVAAAKAPAFKAGKALKDKVNTPAKKKAKK